MSSQANIPNYNIETYNLVNLLYILISLFYSVFVESIKKPTLQSLLESSTLKLGQRSKFQK